MDTLDQPHAWDIGSMNTKAQYMFPMRSSCNLGIIHTNGL